MAKSKKNILSKKNNKNMIMLYVILALLFLVSICFLYNIYFKKVNNYLIENNYYGFRVQTPKDWVAIGKTLYSEDNILNLISECKNKKIPKEIGAFRFESQRYPEAFGDKGSSFIGITSGAILEVTVNCIIDDIKSYSGNIIIDEENAVEDILNLPGFGKTSQLSLMHNDLQYKIKEYIYISSMDKEIERELKEKYDSIFANIISSFKFTK